MEESLLLCRLGVSQRQLTDMVGELNLAREYRPINVVDQQKKKSLRGQHGVFVAKFLIATSDRCTHV